MPETIRVWLIEDHKTYGERLARVFIKNRQHLVRPAIAGLVVDKINLPDMVREVRPQPDD